jgi:hypothetical protein
VLGRAGPSWAASGSAVERRGVCGTLGRKSRGWLQTWLLWAQNETGQNRGGEKVKRKRFSNFKNNQTNEFKHEFEFKHSKTMQQHVCNNKLLYFIILINKKD